MMLFCGIAMISTSCGKDPSVKPETEKGSMVVGTQTLDINKAEAVNYGQKNAIVLASKPMTEDNNNGVAIVFNGDITPGVYTFGESKNDPTPGLTVVGLHEFNMGELPFVLGNDTVFFGDTYFCISGQLEVVESNGTYTVILSQCTANNANNAHINLSAYYSGTLEPFVISTDNKFTINGMESPIGLAGITSIGGMNSIGEYQGIHSMLLMSANHKRAFIVSFVGNESVDGEYQLGYFVTPYLPTLPCVHVALDSDFWTMQPQTGYVAKEGTLKIVTNTDGTKTVTMRNLKLKNVEHGNESFWPVLNAELTYHGYMYEIGK